MIFHTTNALAEASAPEGELHRLLGRLDLGRTFYETPMSGWILLLAGIATGVVVGKIVHTTLRAAAARFRQRGWAMREMICLDAAGPTHLLLIAIGLTIGLAPIVMTANVREFTTRVLAFLHIVVLGWFLFNLVDLVDLVLRRFTTRTQSALDDQIVPLIRKTLRLFLVVVFMLFTAENIFGADITAWLAGLGIAGLAVSLAAQDSIKNLFGSITIFLDRPFAMGDRIIFDGHDGPVEEIGFRSTKVRTLTGEVLTIPNSRFIDNSVLNVSRRPSIRKTMNLRLPHHTPPDKVEQAVRIIKDILAEPEIAVGWDAAKSPPRVAFDNVTPDSLNIVIFYWFSPPNWWDYLDHAQRFNLRLMRRFAEAGIEFAFPTQRIHLTDGNKGDRTMDLPDGGSEDPSADEIGTG